MMIFQNEYNQEFKFAFSDLSMKQIVYNLRPGDWYERRHAGWNHVLSLLKKSILEHGIWYPLCILYRGRYECTHGGQRFKAYQELELEKVPVIICYPKQYWNEIEFPLIGYNDLHILNHNNVEKIYVANNDFHILVKDRKDWDPNDYQRPDSRVHQ